MLKGKTSSIATIAAMLLSTTFLVSEAQARRYDGVSTQRTYQLNNTEIKKKPVLSKKHARKKSYKSRKYVRNRAPRHHHQEVMSRSVSRALYSADQSAASNQTGFFSWGQRSASHMNRAESMVGMTARGNRQDLAQMFASTFSKAVDPLRTPWCAAWANAVLAKEGIQGTGSLLARSFLDWGTKTNNPSKGDVVVLARGRSSASGHVGFFVERAEINGRRYVKVLGGNTGKAVRTAWYPESRVLGYRTHS